MTVQRAALLAEDEVLVIKIGERETRIHAAREKARIALQRHSDQWLAKFAHVHINRVVRLDEKDLAVLEAWVKDSLVSRHAVSIAVNRGRFTVTDVDPGSSDLAMSQDVDPKGEEDERLNSLLFAAVESTTPEQKRRLNVWGDRLRSTARVAIITAIVGGPLSLVINNSLATSYFVRIHKEPFKYSSKPPPPYSSPLWFDVFRLGLLVLPAVGLILHRYATRLEAQGSRPTSLPSRYVLLLRNFSIDRRKGHLLQIVGSFFQPTFAYSVLRSDGTGDHFEIPLRRACARLGDLIAVADPESSPWDSGAKRLPPLRADDWQVAVRSLIERAELIIIVPSISGAVRWEIETAIAVRGKTPIVLLFTDAQEYLAYLNGAPRQLVDELGLRAASAQLPPMRRFRKRPLLVSYASGDPVLIEVVRKGWSRPSKTDWTAGFGAALASYKSPYGR